MLKLINNLKTGIKKWRRIWHTVARVAPQLSLAARLADLIWNQSQTLPKSERLNWWELISMKRLSLLAK